VVPLGLNSAQYRSVALILMKAVNYDNVKHLFREDLNDPQIAQDSLLLLEILTLTLENWASATPVHKDKYLRSLVMNSIEVLVHCHAFWQRLKHSAVLAKLILEI